jgi:hypothetical protein
MPAASSGCKEEFTGNGEITGTCEMLHCESFLEVFVKDSAM